MPFSHCHSCLSNKSHKLPFGELSLVSCSLLDLVYSYVWGPSPLIFVNNFKCYVKFVDHFTKYTWLNPISFKYDVHAYIYNIQSLSISIFQNKTNHTILEYGGKYPKLKSFL